MKFVKSLAAACVAMVLATSANANVVTFAFEATRANVISGTSAAGSAVEFALSDAGENITGEFSFDPVLGATGDFSISIFGPALTVFSRNQDSNGAILRIQDGVAPSRFPDTIGIQTFEAPDQIDLFLAFQSQSAFDNGVPSNFALTDLAIASISLFDLTDQNFGNGGARYNITALNRIPDPAPVVPLPASSLLLIGGMAGLVALRRRKKAA